MWRFAERYDLHMLMQSARTVSPRAGGAAGGQGARNSHEWTPKKPVAAALR
jgi:hypothetical protein